MTHELVSAAVEAASEESFPLPAGEAEEIPASRADFVPPPQAVEIHLHGALEISRAAGLKAELLAALATPDLLHLHLEAVTDLDVTAVQLLAALRQAAGERLRLVSRPPAELLAALSAAGLDGLLLQGL